MAQQGIVKTLNGFKAFLDALWKFFSSLQLAIILILILVGLSLIGTLVTQVPAAYTASPGDYSWWLQNIAQPQTGFWYPLLNFGDLFNVFHSAWFLGTGVLLIISIIVCSLNRLKQVQSVISQSRIKNPEEFYISGKNSIELSELPANSASVNLLTRILKKRHYTVRNETYSGNIYVAADKNRYSPLGTYLIHLSLILFIAGYLIGSFFGFRDTSFIVPEQSTRDIGYKTGLSIYLNSFLAEYWPDGAPKDYQSDVVIYKNGQEVRESTIQVNHPLVYDGVNIYQSFFGPATQIQIKSADGKTLFEGNVALDATTLDYPYQRPSGEFQLSQEGYEVLITGRATNTNDPVLGKGQVDLDIYKTGSTTPVASTTLDQGVPYNADGLEITYQGDSSFSGFEISHDPGINIIWAASGLFLTGLLAIFYFPRRRIWAFYKDDTDAGKRFWIRTDPGNKTGEFTELMTLVDRFKQDLVQADRD